jgi:TetR/AcrR family transcriptional repressor of nem operon
MLEAGEKLFLERGYAAVGLRELLEVVGVSKGAFYHFFPTKEAFAVAVLGNHLEYRLRRLETLLAGDIGLRDLLAWLEEEAAVQIANAYVAPCLVRRLGADLGAGMPVEPVALALASLTDTLGAAIRRGQQAGGLYKELDARAAAVHVLDVWHGAAERARVEGHDTALKAALAHVEAWLKP